MVTVNLLISIFDIKQRSIVALSFAWFPPIFYLYVTNTLFNLFIIVKIFPDALTVKYLIQGSLLCCVKVWALKALTCKFECLKKITVLMSPRQRAWYMGSAGVLLSEMYKICDISWRGLQAWHEERSVCNLAHEKIYCPHRTAQCTAISKHAGLNWTLWLLEDTSFSYVSTPNCIQ